MSFNNRTLKTIHTKFYHSETKGSTLNSSGSVIKFFKALRLSINIMHFSLILSTCYIKSQFEIRLLKIVLECDFSLSYKKVD